MISIVKDGLPGNRHSSWRFPHWPMLLNVDVCSRCERTMQDIVEYRPRCKQLTMNRVRMLKERGRGQVTKLRGR